MLNASSGNLLPFAEPEPRPLMIVIIEEPPRLNVMNSKACRKILSQEWKNIHAVPIVSNNLAPANHMLNSTKLSEHAGPCVIWTLEISMDTMVTMWLLKAHMKMNAPIVERSHGKNTCSTNSYPFAETRLKVLTTTRNGSRPISNVMILNTTRMISLENCKPIQIALNVSMPFPDVQLMTNSPKNSTTVGKCVRLKAKQTEKEEDKVQTVNLTF